MMILGRKCLFQIEGSESDEIVVESWMKGKKMRMGEKMRKGEKRKEILHDEEHLIQHHSQWMDYDGYDGESDDVQE